VGKLNPEKCSQILQEMNRYLDVIPMEKSTGKEKVRIVKAYGKTLRDDEIRYIMGRAIPPEWTVDLLALDKEPWQFKALNDQLDTYRQQWQSDQKNQIMIKMAGKLPVKSSQAMASAKIMSSTIQFNVIYFNCAFTKLIVPKAGNRTLATMPARKSWVMAQLSHSCSQSVGMIDVTVTTVAVVFCIVQI
jgi:hypothetical protein